MIRDNKKRNLLDIAFLAVIVSIIALRLSFMENPSVESLSIPGIFYDHIVSISISSLLIILAVLWFAIKLSGNKYRCGVFEYGVLLFCVAVVLSSIFASNHRVAITNSIMILSAMLTGVVLSNILKTIERRKIFLFVLIGVAIANVYQCTEQFYSSNEIMIKEYEAEPEKHLQKLGIEPGSLEQMLYEHRLYSKDVRGFFTTGNSTGCLLVLAIFCTIAAFDFTINSSDIKTVMKKLWFPILLIFALMMGLLETHSKGAFVSLIAGGILLLIFIKSGNLLMQYKKIVILGVAILAVIGISTLVSYGIKYRTLPGGKSMLVRWQYWVAAAQISAKHILTGVGGSNFGIYYTHYKLPEGLETVKDPHCFILNLTSEYGIIGLAGFCIAAFAPLLRYAQNRKNPDIVETNLISISRICGFILIITLLLIRPLAIRAEVGNMIDVAMYIITIIYIAPVFFAAVVLWMCVRTEELTTKKTISLIALACGIAAVLIHNLIDFAIFEPGIMTAFWGCIGLVQSYQQQTDFEKITKPNRLRKPLCVISVIGTATALIWLCIIPTVKVANKLEKAKLFFANGEFGEGLSLLLEAKENDILNPTPAAFAGKVFLYKFNMNPSNDQTDLLNAEKALFTAIERNKADFGNYADLGRVYVTLAQITPDKRSFWLGKATTAFENALKMYPSSSQLHFELAEVYEQAGKIDAAIEHYKKAVEIEDIFTKQFKIMYPEREIVSRMGKIKYTTAKEKIENLLR